MGNTDSMNTTHSTEGITLPHDLPAQPNSDQISFDDLSESPSMLKMYLKILKPRPGLKEGDSVPKYGVECMMKISQDWLNAYTQICGWTSSNQDLVPITAPQVLAAPLHMYLLTHQLFPSSALGVVHAENEMIAHKPIDPKLPLKVKSWIGETHWKARGFQVDMYTTVSQNDEEKPRWLAKTSLFRTAKTSQKSTHSSKTDQLINGDEQALQLSANLGRRYAPIAGDFNPIHLYPITAKLFGFKRPIIHGMWTLGHLLSEVVPDLHQLCCGRLAVRFRRPLALPLKSTWRHQTAANTKFMQALDPRGKLAVDIAFEAKEISSTTDVNEC